MVVASPDDLVGAVARDRRMAAYRVRRQGDGWIELEVVAQRARIPVLLVLAWPSVWTDAAALRPHLIRARSGNYGLVLVGTDAEIEEARLDTLSADTDVIAAVAPIGIARLLLLLRARAEAIAQRLAAATLELEIERSRHENDMLNSIGRALSQERKLESLLPIILRRACELTNADAGSIYVVVGHDDDVAKRTLRFAASQNDSRQVPAAGFEMPVSASSIVGQCVLSGERISVPDLYALDEPGTGNNPWGFAHDRTFDDRYGYQTRSVLAVPMISARAEVIGVIQLINKRARGWIQLDLPADFNDGVVPFDEVSVAYVSTLASQAGIALENVLLYEEVKTLFDGFVNAAVQAIESRDPTTSGHSERVADLTLGLARAVNAHDRGHYGQIHFSDDELVQIQYAALLHDFGKVGVREHVLVKAKKLYEHERELILQRFRVIKRGYQIEGLESKVRYLMES
ncbi:MAG TPA: GAF domain-containing protein, partial [Kofleriaceae bacterium]|nr:GAF domain-containing protein [Kofleriaceae bacterium]